MNTEFGELAQARYRSRNRRRKIYVFVGLLLIVSGYYLMAVSPQAAPNWALLRAIGGLACIVVGFGFAIFPLLSSWSSDE